MCKSTVSHICLSSKQFRVFNQDDFPLILPARAVRTLSAAKRARAARQHHGRAAVQVPMQEQNHENMHLESKRLLLGFSTSDLALYRVHEISF